MPDTSPRDTTFVCSQSLTMKLPPALALFASTASNTSRSEIPYLSRRSGSGRMWYCLTNPPKLFTSVTPGRVRSCMLTCQFCSVRSPVRSYPESSSAAPQTGQAPGSRDQTSP